MAITWRWMVGLIAGLLLLRISGIIPTIVVAVGVVGLFLLVWAFSAVPVVGRFATIALIAWVTMFYALPIAWNAVLSRWPRTQEAADQRAVWTDIESAERTRVHALQEYTAFRRWCNQVESREGTGVENAYGELYRLYERGEIPPQALRSRDTELRDRIRNNAAWRAECARFLTTNISIPPVGGGGIWQKFTDVLGGKATSAVALYWTVAALLIAAVVLFQLFKGNIAGVFGWGLALLAVALFFGYYVRDEEERERRAQVAQAARPPRAEAAPSPTPPRVIPPSREQSVQPQRRSEQPGIDPTLVRRGDGLAHVGITGVNQCPRTSAPVHCTGIMVPPGGEAAVRHLRGAFVLDRKNEPVPLCGDKKESRRGLAFPLIPRYAMAVSLATPDYDYEPREWRCGEEEIRLANSGTEPLEIVLFFNDHGRRGRDPSRRDRVWFAVELKHRAGWKNPAIAPAM